ncbi:MAG: thioredoxin family protein [Clostridiaceae bacterium]
MKILNEDLQRQLKDIITGLRGDVTIALFTDKDCSSYSETASYMEEVAALSDKIHLVKYDFRKDADKAAEYNVQMVPGIVLLDSKNNYKGIRFAGIPAGYEIKSFIEAMVEVSGAANQLPEDLAKRIEAVKNPIDIKVFVTLTCPRCSGAVQEAYELALMNKNIETEMIEAEAFPDLVDLYKISSVPEIIINNKYEILGNQPLETFVDTIEAIG